MTLELSLFQYMSLHFIEKKIFIVNKQKTTKNTNNYYKQYYTIYYI